MAKIEIFGNFGMDSECVDLYDLIRGEKSCNKKSNSNIKSDTEETVTIKYIVEIKEKEPLQMPIYIGSHGISKTGEPDLYIVYNDTNLAMEFDTIEEAKEIIDYFVEAGKITDKTFIIKRIRKCIANSGIEYKPVKCKIIYRYAYGLVDIENGEIVNTLLDDRSTEKDIPDNISYDPDSGLCCVHIKIEEFKEDYSYIKAFFKDKKSLYGHILAVTKESK